MTTPTREQFAQWHAEAIVAKIQNPKVALEVFGYSDRWIPDENDEPPFVFTPGGLRYHWTLYRRLTPTPPPPVRVPLDASDFVGPERVTHVRSYSSGSIFAVIWIDEPEIGYGTSGRITFQQLQQSDYAISRDGGATWTAASKAKEGA